MGGNQLSSLPAVLSRCSNLHTLTISKNPPLTALPKVKVRIQSHALLTTWMQGLVDLPALKKMQMKGTALSEDDLYTAKEKLEARGGSVEF